MKGDAVIRPDIDVDAYYSFIAATTLALTLRH